MSRRTSLQCISMIDPCCLRNIAVPLWIFRVWTRVKVTGRSPKSVSTTLLITWPNSRYLGQMAFTESERKKGRMIRLESALACAISSRVEAVHRDPKNPPGKPLALGRTDYPLRIP
jgi:hypothetical protein